MAGFSVEMRASGAVFNGVAEKAGHDFANQLKQEVADTGERMVKIQLARVLRVDRGVYIGWTHQVYESDDIVVTDRWIVYGPWLEGVGSRVGPPGSGKWPLTRFEGYHTYRIVSGELNIITRTIALRVIPPYLAEMNS